MALGRAGNWAGEADFLFERGISEVVNGMKRIALGAYCQHTHTEAGAGPDIVFVLIFGGDLRGRRRCVWSENLLLG